MSIEKTNKLKWINIIDTKKLIIGIALVKKSFVAQLHTHKKPENYYFLYGSAKMALGNDILMINSPKKIKIPSNIPHAMTPITSFVILVYTFYKGPFKDIKYTYLQSTL